MRAQTSIRIEDKAAGRLPRTHVMSRMNQLLKRLPVRPLSASVTFSDVNGPKGGADKRCAILVSLPGEPSIRVERIATSARLAFDRTYERVQRQTERPRRRWRESQRRPKKYYAAKRLWT
jgi:putative sigma-54 modulation protein